MRDRVYDKTVNGIIKDLKAKFPQLKYTMYKEDLTENGLGYSYSIFIDYMISDEIKLNTVLFLFSAAYTKDKAEVVNEKTYIEFLNKEHECEVNDWFFNDLTYKGMDGYKIIEDCKTFFYKKYKDTLLAKLNKS